MEAEHWKRKALEKVWVCRRVILWASPPSLGTAAPGRPHTITISYYVKQKHAPLLPSLTALPFGGLDLQLTEESYSPSCPNEMESSEPPRQKGYPDSGPTIALIVSMGAKQSPATQFPVGWSSQAPGAPGYFSFPHFPSPPRSPLSLPSTPLHLPLIPSQSHPHLNPKEQLRSPRATVWVQFPSTWGTLPLCVCSPDPSTEVLLQHPRNTPQQTLDIFVLESTQTVHCQKRHKSPRDKHPFAFLIVWDCHVREQMKHHLLGPCLGDTARQCRESLNGKAESGAIP